MARKVKDMSNSEIYETMFRLIDEVISRRIVDLEKTESQLIKEGYISELQELKRSRTNLSIYSK